MYKRNKYRRKKNNVNVLKKRRLAGLGKGKKIHFQITSREFSMFVVKERK